MSRILELFGVAATGKKRADWQNITRKRWCPYLNRLCSKSRKSSPDILMGTCCVFYGRGKKGIIICPHRLLERKQIFTDCLHLLTLHEPGNEFHIVPEISIPGGSVDYFLVSAKKGKVKDFVGIELQTLDTTGTVWPERQRFLHGVGIRADRADVACKDSFGINWKMTAKTILVQLHHKIETFESISKHLVLAVQDCLIEYMRSNFTFSHIEDARLGDAMHFHSYRLVENKQHQWQLELASRYSTDAQGISRALGMQGSAKIEVEAITAILEEKISSKTLFTF